jgi:hypothetical protein
MDSLENFFNNHNPLASAFRNYRQELEELERNADGTYSRDLKMYLYRTGQDRAQDQNLVRRYNPNAAPGQIAAIYTEHNLPSRYYVNLLK